MFEVDREGGSSKNSLKACRETERRRTMARIQGQVVGGAVKSVSHRESKFLSLVSWHSTSSTHMVSSNLHT